MIRRLIREMILQEKSLADVLGKTPKQEPNAGREEGNGDALYYPQYRSTAEFRRDKKKMWNKYADHTYFQSPSKLFVYHYLGHYSGNGALEDYFPRGASVPGKIAGIDFPNKNELSCFGGPAKWGGADSVQLQMPFFTFKKYRVTFASAEDAATERLSNATPTDIQRHVGSGLPKRPNLYQEYEMMPLDEEGVLDVGGSLEEVVIDNWVIDTYHCEKGDVKYAEELGLEYKLLGPPYFGG
jgi:hypothetical protein